MLFCVDIGNSSISFGLFDLCLDSRTNENKKTLVMSSKISAATSRSSDEYASAFYQMMSLYKFSCESIEHVAVASVVPRLTKNVCRAIEIISGKKPYLIAPGIKTGFRIGIYDPAMLGADIVANISASLDITEPPFVIFDAGTANTLTFVNSDKTVAGTIISPGLRISLEALTDNAEQIENITINENNDIPWIGRNTSESICSGVVLGNALMVDGFIRNIRENYIEQNSDKKLSLIATGGYCDIIASKTRNKFIIEKSLTLSGIASLYIKNILVR